MILDEFVQIIKNELESKFGDIDENYKSMLIQISKVLFYFKNDSTFIDILRKSENIEEFILDSLRFSKIIIKDYESKIKIIKEKEYKSFEDYNFLFILDNINNYLEIYKDLL